MNTKVKLVQGLCVSMVALLMAGDATAATAENICLRSQLLSKELYSYMPDWSRASVQDKAKYSVVSRICDMAHRHKKDGKLGALANILLAAQGKRGDLQGAVEAWNAENPEDQFKIKLVGGKEVAIQWE